MRELSIFLDESGSDGLRDPFYLLAIIVHEQTTSLTESIQRYENALKMRRLPDIPFHALPLLNGHGPYKNLPLAIRKQMLSTFRVFLRHTPIRFHCIKLTTKHYGTADALSRAMRKELIEFLVSHLNYFQSFNPIKVYYDNGQKSIAGAVHKAVDHALAQGSVMYRIASPQDYRLAQAADYVCTMELTALKYENGLSTSTDEKFFGSRRQFKKGIYKELADKAI